MVPSSWLATNFAHLIHFVCVCVFVCNSVDKIWYELDWLLAWLIDCLNGWMVGWMVGWSVLGDCKFGEGDHR